MIHNFERNLWAWLANLALICMPLVGMASTAVERVALYLMPIQLLVFSGLYLLTNNVTLRTSIIAGVVFFYALVQWVWLNMASHAFPWLPYKFTLFQ